MNEKNLDESDGGAFRQLVTTYASQLGLTENQLAERFEVDLATMAGWMEGKTLSLPSCGPALTKIIAHSLTAAVLLMRCVRADLQDREVFREIVVDYARLLERTDAQLAKRFGIARTTVTRWKAGRTTPGLLIRELVVAKMVEDLGKLGEGV